MTTGRMDMLFNFSDIEIATGRIGAYFKTMLILPLDAFIEIVKGRMSFIISGTALILPLGFVMRQPLGVWVYISRAYINITTGHMCTYIDPNRIEIAIRCISLIFLGLYQCCHEACVYQY